MKLAIAHTADKTVYTALRRRLNGYIYNPVAGTEEAVGTWNETRKQQCAIALTDREGRYYDLTLPAGLTDGIYDAICFEQAGAAESLNDRIIGRSAIKNGDASYAERVMLAVAAETGKTIYAVIRSEDNACVWDADAEKLEEAGTWNNTRLAECAYALDDKGGGYYTKQFPPGCDTAGNYHIFYYLQAAAAPAMGDRLIGRDKVVWW